ncbi:MAG: chloride channel protein [Elusimicrobiota bacterium]
MTPAPHNKPDDKKSPAPDINALPGWIIDALKLWQETRVWLADTYRDLRPMLAPSETKFLVALAVLIGLLTGGFTYLFDGFIHRIFHFAFGMNTLQLAELPLYSRWKILFLPALGGLIVGPLVKYVSPDSKGEGVPNVLKAMHHQGGRLRGRVALLKALCSALSIGTGGSAGREGPVVLIGASIGSRLAQMFRVPAVTLKTMAAAGSAAGIGAVFNAPLGGMAFGLEVILGEITAGPFAMVVLSTVVADTMARMLRGSSSFFTIPAHGMTHWSELGLYLVLGVAAGICAKVFQHIFLRVEDEFEAHCPMDPAWKPALGGLLVGALGFLVPEILGPGYEVIDSALRTSFAPSLLLLLIAGKMLATSLTLGSGGSGGTLMPSLFMGGMLGSLLGQAFAAIFPGTLDPSAYATVGMAAMFAGMVNAPLTAILILFEMTGDYAIILPLMVAVVTSVLTARVIEAESIYTLKLARLGISYRPEPETALLTGTPVSEIMTKDVKVIKSDFALGQLGRYFNRTKLNGFPVIDQDGRLVGMITHAEARAAYTSEPPPPADAPVESIMRSTGQPLYADDSASEALRRMDQLDTDRLPVVDRNNPQRLVGIVSQKDLMHLYAKRISRKTDRKTER